MLDAIRAFGIKAPIVVAKATLCDAWRFQNPPIPHFENRKEIRSYKDPSRSARGIFAGPDTDTLGVEERYVDCHFNANGVKRHASLWLELLRRIPLNSPSRPMQYYRKKPCCRREASRNANSAKEQRERAMSAASQLANRPVHIRLLTAIGNRHNFLIRSRLQCYPVTPVPHDDVQTDG